MATTGNFTSSELLAHETDLKLPKMTNSEAVALGKLATELASERNYPVAIQVQFGNWVVYKAALPGSSEENDGWIKRKANVVLMKHHSTMYERVKSEEDGINWHEVNKVEDATHAIHGGGFPLVDSDGFKGVFLISGLPQVEDHLFAVEVLTKFKQ